MITIIESGRRAFSPAEVVREYVEFGSLLKHLTLRDLRLRYRRTTLGVLWVVLQPLLSTLIFAAVFARVLRPSTGGIPYGLFAMAGVVPWTFFSSSMTRASLIFSSSSGLMAKVYFPRAILPVSTVLGNSLDLLVGCLLVCLYAIGSGYYPDWRWLLLPVVAIHTILTAFFVSLALAVANVLQRDLRHAMTFITQLWLYASPVVYPSTLVSERFRWLFGLNPMTAVLDGFRWCLFGTPADPQLFLMSLASLVFVACGSVWLFYKFERSLVERA